MPANYNLTPCARSRKPAGARTMGNNGKKQCAEPSKQSEYGSTCTTIGREAADALARTPPRGHEKKPADEQGAGDTRKKPRLEFPPSPILHEIASERQKRSRHSCGAPLAPPACTPRESRCRAPCRFPHSRLRSSMSTAMVVSLSPIIAASPTSWPRADHLPAARREPCSAASDPTATLSLDQSPYWRRFKPIEMSCTREPASKGSRRLS
jgi:hypothetical protein